jgi:2'-5' RNA ligase
MSDGGAAFLALDPEPWLAAAIHAAKATVRDLVGAQRYLDDPPHLTLFVGSFPDRLAVARRLAEQAASWRAPVAAAVGWHVFHDDPLTGGHTVVARLEPGALAPLRRLQGDALAAVAPLRDLDASRARYAGARDRLAPVRLESLDRHGFPFTGDDWQPHVSVASIATAAWSVAWPAIEAMAPRGAVRFPSLGWYALDGDRPRRLAEVPLP